MQYDEHDLGALALCAWMEARGEPWDGIRAVMHVVVNRAKRWYGNAVGSIHRAVYAPNQFSWTRADNPEHSLHPTDSSLFEKIRLAAGDIASGKDPDNTLGAFYYANLNTENSDWFETHIVNSPEHQRTAVIGRHTFFA